MSRTFALGLTLLVLSLALAACGGGAEPTEAPPFGDPQAGAEVFAGTCASCHGATWTGIEGLGKNLTTSEWVSQQSDAQLVKFIKTGRPATDKLNTTGVDMPPKGGNPALTDADIENVVAFVRSIHQ